MFFTKLERVLFYITLFTIASIISTSYFLPMLDLPQHAGQVQSFKTIFLGQADSSWFQKLEVNYFTTYWIGYLFTFLFSFILPINYAINTVVGMAFLLFVLSFSSLRKDFNSPAVLDWVLMPSFFGFAYMLGLLTFVLAIPLGVFLLKQNLRLIHTGQKKYIYSTFIIGFFLYFSHILIFLLFCLIASLMTLVNQADTFKSKLKKLLPFYILVFLVPLYFLIPILCNQGDLGQYFNLINYSNFNFGIFDLKIINFLVYPWALQTEDYLIPLELISIFILIFPFFMGYRLSSDIKKYIPLFSFLLAWFLLPTQMAKTSFIYERFSIFLFPFYILIFERRSEYLTLIEKRIKIFFSCLWIFLCIGMLKPPVKDIFSFNQETKDFHAIIEKLPEKKIALSLVYDTSGQIGRRIDSSFAYFPLWYQAIKNGWVEYNFAWFSPQIVKYKSDAVPENRPGFAWNPKMFSTFKKCNYYDLLIVRTVNEEQYQIHEKLMTQSTCSHHLIYQNGFWSIYSLE